MTSKNQRTFLLASAMMAVLGMNNPANSQMSDAQKQTFEQQRGQYLESLTPRTQAEKDAAWADYDALESSAARANAEKQDKKAEALENQKKSRAAMKLIEQTRDMEVELKRQREKIGKERPYGKPNISPTDAPLKLSPGELEGHERMYALLVERVGIELEKEDDDRSYLAVVRAYEEAWALGFRDSELPYILGFALMQIGDAEEAIRWLAHYLKTHRNRSSQDYAHALETYKAANKELSGWHDFHQRFEWSDKARGEVKDRKTGLIWEFCNSGDGFWEGRWCSGLQQEKTWDEAMVYAMDKARRTGQPWRVPSREELKDAVRYFPGALAGGYMWTTSQSNDGRAYVLSGYMAWVQRVQPDGEAVPEAQLGPNTSKQQRHYYRLVR